MDTNNMSVKVSFFALPMMNLKLGEILDLNTMIHMREKRLLFLWLR